jgi:hypothetical protein
LLAHLSVISSLIICLHFLKFLLRDSLIGQDNTVVNKVTILLQ